MMDEDPGYVVVKDLGTAKLIYFETSREWEESYYIVYADGREKFIYSDMYAADYPEDITWGRHIEEIVFIFYKLGFTAALKQVSDGLSNNVK